jgi:DNA-directed RNA polymerase subunit RPC12/RpoP
LVKGSHAPRVVALCSKCGAEFERSAVHPYIVDCPDCRSTKAKARKAATGVARKVKCKTCRSMLDTDGGLRMHVCKYCGEQWWSMPGKVWRRWNTGEVFSGQALFGNVNEEPVKDILDKITQSVL